MASRRNNNNLINNLKDYIVPIIGIFLILFLIYSFFFSGDKKNAKDIENKVGINLEFSSEDTKAKVVYPGGKESDINSKTDLYKGEKIIVSEGRVKVENKDKYNFNIKKLGELKYNSDNDFSVLNGDIWLDTNTALNISMKYGKLSISKDSHLSFIQNEVSSTIYLISGMAEVSNKAGKTSVLTSKEKIEISKQDSQNKDIDLSKKKEPLDDFFKNSSWFTLNNGETYLEAKTGSGGEENTGSGEIETKKFVSSDSLSFGNLEDESNVSSSKIDIYGNYNLDDVEKITVNTDKIATLNKNTKSFNFDSVDVSKKVNDLVFKVYDGTDTLIDKVTYTVYYDGASGTKKAPLKIESNKFDVDGSDFSFISPSTNNIYTTYENLITIKGKVTAKNITKVTVNEYPLKSFNGKSWMYHARKDFGNLVDGTNEYEIKYFSGKDVVYKNYYTIVKKAGKAPEEKEDKNEKKE